MSQVSEVANTATAVDWKLIAAAAATFLATFIIAIFGWMQGKKKVSERFTSSNDVPVTSAVLLDNQTLREATLVNREVRDQLLLHSQALNANCKATVDNTGSMDDILHELRELRRSVDKLPTRP